MNLHTSLSYAGSFFYHVTLFSSICKQKVIKRAIQNVIFSINIIVSGKIAHFLLFQ